MPREERFLTRDGCTLRYWLRGEGPLITLTPGGREGGEAVASLADLLAEEACVLTWDRRNAGAADVWFGGDVEAEVWADDLSDLIAHLDMGPAWIAGGSAGCRTSVISALRHPETARGLLLWSASGGQYSCQFLGFSYHVPYIMAAESGGMEAVVKSPFFADRIAANPDNRERLMGLDPAEFVEQMKCWNRAFYYSADASLAGVPDAALSMISVPTLIVAGNDDVHPPTASNAIARLVPGATHIPSPWSNEQWLDMFTGRKGGSVFGLYPLLAPALLTFVGRHS
jgi:pimeloyl-ACP methyl ester carboxylesterase